LQIHAILLELHQVGSRAKRDLFLFERFSRGGLGLLSKNRGFLVLEGIEIVGGLHMVGGKRWWRYWRAVKF
jgi:hypothetical protein